MYTFENSTKANKKKHHYVVIYSLTFFSFYKFMGTIESDLEAGLCWLELV